ncbi:MAG: hypothetical protein RL755_50 [Pseudomonadota bacterium]|jgi:uncharacterized protein YfdQ (DUF2303 family)
MSEQQSQIAETVKQALAATQRLPNDAAIIPDGYKLENLERFYDHPNLFKGTFSTTILSEFADYVSKHGNEGSAVFIDNERIKALAIIDMGSHDAPQWGKHRAEIELLKTPAYAALLKFNNQQLDQQGFIDFVEDWRENITFIFDDNSEQSVEKVVKSLRKVKVGFNATKEQEVQASSSSRSLLESVEIKAGNEPLPIGFVFSTLAYDGIETAYFNCPLRVTSDEKAVRFKFRIGQLDAINERISIEFKNAIAESFDETNIPIHIGKMSYQ